MRCSLRSRVVRAPLSRRRSPWGSRPLLSSLTRRPSTHRHPLTRPPPSYRHPRSRDRPPLTPLLRSCCQQDEFSRKLRTTPLTKTFPDAPGDTDAQSSDGEMSHGLVDGISQRYIIHIFH